MVDTARLLEAARLLLAEAAPTALGLDVSIVDDAEIRVLNRDYRGKDASTDVLAFSQTQGEPISDGSATPAQAEAGAAARADHLGDIVISADSAERQAQTGGWTLEQEINRLLVHGLLHLLGYDHVDGGARQARMQSQELRLAQLLESAGFACAREDLA